MPNPTMFAARSLTLFALIVGLAGCRNNNPEAPAPPADPPREATPGPAATATAGEAGTMQVWKSPTCGCCAAWVEHMRHEGFTVEVIDTPDLAAIKTELGVPQGMGSCHTAKVGDYVLEGHVPAREVRRLLAERPEGVSGLAVPGMPVGSPGMEVPGQPAQPYAVVAFGPGGEGVFAQYR